MESLKISSGVWYVGVFNGIGSARTHKAMINQGSLFSVNVSVEQCRISGLWGQYCNQTVFPLSCPGSDIYMNVKNHSDASVYIQRTEKVTTCRNSFEASCFGDRAPRGYSMDVNGLVEQLKIMTVKTSLNERHSANKTRNVPGILYARYGAMPSSSLHDYAIDARKTPLVIQSPKVGRWYFSLLPAKQAKGQGATDEKSTIANFCYSLDPQILECPTGKAGPNCAWESYMLQRMIGGSPSIGLYYWSTGESTTFLLELLLSNSSGEDKLEYAWTYFLVDIGTA